MCFLIRIDKTAVGKEKVQKQKEIPLKGELFLAIFIMHEKRSTIIERRLRTVTPDHRGLSGNYQLFKREMKFVKIRSLLRAEALSAPNNHPENSEYSTSKLTD